MNQLTYHRIKLNELRKGNLAILEALNGNHKEVNIPLIERYVSGAAKMSTSKIYRRTRKREVVQVRQLVHYFALRYTRKTTSEVGWMCGRYNHATVLHSKKNIENLIETDKYMRELHNKIDHRLSAHVPKNDKIR